MDTNNSCYCRKNLGTYRISKLEKIGPQVFIHQTSYYTFRKIFLHSWVNPYTEIKNRLKSVNLQFLCFLNKNLP